MADSNERENQELDPAKLENLLEAESESISESEENDAFEAAISGQAKDDIAAQPGARKDDPEEEEDEPNPDGEQEEEPSWEADQEKDKTGKESANADDAAQQQQQEQPDDRDQYIQKLEQRIRNMEGKFGTLNAQLQQARQSTQAQGSNAPSNEQIKEAAKNSEKLEQLKEDFPEWSEALTEQLGLTKQELSGAFISKEDFDKYMREQREVLQEEILDMRHGGWKDTLNSSEFMEWFNAQDEATQALADSERVADAIQMLDAFEDHRKAQERPANEEQNQQQQDQRQQNQDRLKASVSPTSGATSTPKRSLSEEEAFEKAASQYSR